MAHIISHTEWNKFPDLFRAAAEAGPHDILKLYNPKGNIINISPGLEPNGPHTCYRLEVVAADCNSEPLGIFKLAARESRRLRFCKSVDSLSFLGISGAELAVALGFDLLSMEKRYNTLNWIWIWILAEHRTRIQDSVQGLVYTVPYVWMWSQAAGPGEENPDRGRRDSCSCVWDEETGRFIPGETGGTELNTRRFHSCMRKQEHGA